MELAGGGGAVDEMQAKADVVRRLLEMADGLRLDMMRVVVALLRPPQVVHFLVAVAELHLAVHHFGRRGVNPSWLAMSSNAHATAPPCRCSSLPELSPVVPALLALPSASFPVPS